jgi:hypothetical protein
MDEIIKWVTTQDWIAWVGAVTALLGAVYSICLLIPGDQPDKTIQAILDFTKKFSKK